MNTHTWVEKTGTFLALIVGLALAPLAWAQEAEESALVVGTANGELQGAMAGDGVRVFKGIPFAAPPVGELRWRAPQPAEDWEGVRDATEFGPECWQAWNAESSEDCLSLNVWTTASVDEPQPVMVWIHGGAFIFGSGSNEWYDGTEFAKSGVVLVTINYRLGLSGFFAHPALSAESEHGVSGNQGIFDQLAALQWVQDNIAAFGGDPDNVTIFGESAGSMSVCYLVATPLSRGLFQKAIGQSGGCFAEHPTLDAELEGGADATGEFVGGGEAIGTAVVQTVGLESTGEEALAELRSRPLNALNRALQQKQRSISWRSIYVDGYMFPDQMRYLIADGDGNPVPSMVGSNTDEGTTLYGQLPETELEMWKVGVRMQMQEDADPEKFIELYMKDAEESTKKASQQMISDLTFAWEMRTWAQLIADRELDSYLYVFSHAPPFPELGDDRTTMGAFHAGEIVFVFNKVDETHWNDDDHAVAKHMHAYWVNFAKTGNPNGEGLPEWSAYSREADNSLDIDASPEITTGYRKAKLDAWEELNQL